MKKYSNWIFAAVVILAFLGALVLMGKRGSEGTAVVSGLDTSAQENVSLVAAEKSFDFGNVSMAEGLVKHVFSVKNIGKEQVAVKKMYTSCMCTTATLSVSGEKYGPFGMPGHGFVPTIKAEFAPGGSGEVEIVFDPAAHGPAGIGKISRVIYLENTAGSPLELAIAANVTP